MEDNNKTKEKVETVKTLETKNIFFNIKLCLDRMFY